ncbi:YfdX family protein [Rhodoblastus sp.]|uniref:YfdX family protein n=1 Tax=Rhodoblastus sp. TaxID=1962975 RepID=UPI003F9AA562
MAFAATDTNSSTPKLTPQEKAVNKDFSKVSADGADAFMDLTLTRFAIFDGRIDAAKKYIDKAEKALSKAKADETRFMKDEASLNTTKNKPTPNSGATTAPTADQQNSSNNTMVEWLPVDASITIDEDFTANPDKKAAVADANKSLSNGDRTNAIEKLKLSGVKIDVVVLALPLKDTIAKVQQAANMINDGKYYEATQVIKQVQDGVRSDVMDFNGKPVNGAQKGASRED